MTDTKNMMQSMASALDEVLNKKGKPKKNGFVLLVFPFDADDQTITGGRVNYVSNCQRNEMIIALKEIVARFEGQPHQSGRA